MLTEICEYLKNWFNRKTDGSEYPKYEGKVNIADGTIGFDGGFELVDGQYYRILGSLFNNGVHKYGDSEDVLTDEVFDGVVWSMAVPPAVVSLAGEIGEWVAKYGGVDSTAMSPFNSESFGGYSYSTSSGGSGSDSSASGSNGWQGVYRPRLAPWRKII